MKPPIVVALLLAACMSAVAQQSAAPKPGTGAQHQPATAGKPATASSNSNSGASAAQGSDINESAALEFVRQLFGYNAEIQYNFVSAKPAEAPGFQEVTVLLSVPQGQQPFRFYVTPDRKYAFVGDITMMPFGTDPFGSTRALLKQKADGPARGPKDAKVEIVEFADLQCPSCKAAQPNVQKLIAEEPTVKIVFQNFPIAAIHPWAQRSARYVDCLGRSNPDIAVKFIDTVFDHQQEINPTNADDLLKSYAEQSGAPMAATAACIADPKTDERIRASYALGEQVGVTGTPTVFINGRRVANFNGVPYEVLKQLVDFAAKEAK